ncbi:MAG: pirin family protein [Desulfobacterales bacterium]|nr:pirin family protein [Desulfobacterales bacterium]MDX2510701.1 pirin family protein [Desulfobacterales bacterium]
MLENRRIAQIIKSQPVLEGAGVHLKRVFGFGNTDLFDPFLLLDDFRSDNPVYYTKGFPWHPHRGIETITYVIDGQVEHSDSLGNSGIISSGDIQWMTAGSGIVHQEMPTGDENGRMGGFQLWANLPASHKMTQPRYRDFTHEQIPEVVLGNGVSIKILCGKAHGKEGPVQDVFIDPAYLDIQVPEGQVFKYPTQQGHTVFAYVIEGQGNFGSQTTKSKDSGQNTETSAMISNETLVLFSDGDQVVVSTRNDAVRFLLISGKPIREPVAWQGPIVMNTQEELQLAFEEYQAGTFIK